MSRVQFMDHKGKQILYLNFAQAKAGEVLETISHAKAIIAAQPPNSVLVLTNVTNAGFNSEVSDAMKQFVTHNKPFVKASGVVGITGLKQIIYNAVVKFSGRNLVAFDTFDQARDWLAEQ